MAVPLSNLSATWATSNTSVNTGIMMDITDIVSADTSKLIELKINGITKFSVDKNGNIFGNISGSSTKWYSGSGPPINTSYNVGDFYIDISTNDIYEKTGSVTWALITNISGISTFVPASSSNSAYMDFAEDIDNGTNYVRIQAPSNLINDVVVTLPSTTGDLLSTSESKNITKGFSVTSYNIGTVTSGIVVPDQTNGNYQYLTNNGAFTFSSLASDGGVEILVTNGATAGNISFSGFTVGSSTGSSLTTTETHKFLVSIRRINSISTYSIYALQ